MRLPQPFIVLATQNPIEYEGTFPLPEAQLDRFIMKISVGYPSAKEEQEILRRRRERRSDAQELKAVTDAEGLHGDARGDRGSVCRPGHWKLISCRSSARLAATAR